MMRRLRSVALLLLIGALVVWSFVVLMLGVLVALTPSGGGVDDHDFAYIDDGFLTSLGVWLALWAAGWVVYRWSRR